MPVVACGLADRAESCWAGSACEMTPEHHRVGADFDRAPNPAGAVRLRNMREVIGSISESDVLNAISAHLGAPIAVVWSGLDRFSDYGNSWGMAPGDRVLEQ